MILILSEINDSSTNEVIDWLNFLNKKWVLINLQDSIEIDYLGNEIIINTSNNSIKLSEIRSFWYRRGYITLKAIFSTSISEFDSLQFEETNKLMSFIYYKLNKIKHLNSITNSSMNKLIVNDIAKSLNISTPKDLIFSNKKCLVSAIKNSEEKYITKVISGHCMQKFEDFTIYNYTSLIDINKIEIDSFFPSLVQNYIPKKYELRIFYIDGEFYSMAIFSQTDSKTKIDFRNYNDENPNRNVPYKLPNHIEEKLDLLMKKLDLNCGSIDMIVTSTNEYVFLEINPVGQFGMVSYPCNYNLEKIIAEYL